MESDITRVLSAAVYEIKDHRVSGGLCTITKVILSPDLATCKVYVSVLGSGDAGANAGKGKGKGSKSENAVSCLQSAEGFLKHEISKSVKLRKIPALRFYADDTQQNFERIDSIIKGIKTE